MSPKKSQARHRASTPTAFQRVSHAASGRGRTAGRQAAVLALGSGLLLTAAVPATAGATASAPGQGFEVGAELPAGDTAKAGAAAETATYTVKSGDTLSLIGIRHDVPLDTILSVNGLDMDSVIYPGDEIKLSGTADTSAPAPATGAAAGSSWTMALQANSITPTESAPTGTSSTNQLILEAALAQMGAVQDCTVLGEVALRAAGIEGVGDESPESLMTYAAPVSTPQPGDFIYYADGGMGFSHNAVYLGDGRAVHSGWNGNQTVIDSVNVGSGPVYYRVNG